MTPLSEWRKQETGDTVPFIDSITELAQTGIYRFVVHARDKDGLYAQPVTMEVDTSYRIFLPTVSR
ncbi:MAG: hypothetical protein AAF639_16835 [Chloroflexota bacterium]